MALQHSVIAYRRECDQLVTQGQKRCTKCKKILALTSFTRDIRKHGGYANHCSVCQSLSWRKRKGRVGIEATVTEQHELAREQRILELSGKRRCATCRHAKELATDFPHRPNKWARFRDDCSECAGTKELLAKTKKSQQGASYRQRHWLLVWARRTLDSHRKRNIEVCVTKKQLLKLVDENGWATCFYTGEQIKVGAGVSVDMKDPRGKFELSNICLCFVGCNSTKGGMAVERFKTYLAHNPEILRRLKAKNEIYLKTYYAKQIPLATLRRLATDASNKEQA